MEGWTERLSWQTEWEWLECSSWRGRELLMVQGMRKCRGKKNPREKGESAGDEEMQREKHPREKGERFLPSK